MENIVYFVRQADDNIFKIGITSGTMKKRLTGLQVGNPKKLRVYGELKTSESHRKIESFLHSKLKELRLEGEWFNLDSSQVDAIIKELQGAKITEQQPNFFKIFNIRNFIVKNVSLFVFYFMLQVFIGTAVLALASLNISYLPVWLHLICMLSILICNHGANFYVFTELQKFISNRNRLVKPVYFV